MKFFAFIGILLCMLAIIMKICSFLYRTRGLYRNRLGYKNRINAKRLPFGLQAVNVGSTYASYAFSYKKSYIKGFNFAQAPQELAYDFQILQQFREHLARGCIVYITLPVFIFSALFHNKLKWNAKYYFFLDKKHIFSYNPLLKLIILMFYPFLLAVCRVMAALGIMKSRTDMAAEYSTLLDTEIEAKIAQMMSTNKKLFEITNMTETDIPPKMQQRMEEAVNTLHEVIHFCLEQGWHPILVSTPCSRKYNEVFSNEFVKAWLYDNIEKANDAGVPYLDYRMHSDFQERYDWFFDGAYMLTKAGREYFMDLLIQDTENIISNCHQNSVPQLFSSPSQCCGCSACRAICSVHAIDMWRNSEGFLYPYIDIHKCIRCGRCLTACPVR